MGGAERCASLWSWPITFLNTVLKDGWSYLDVKLIQGSSGAGAFGSSVASEAGAGSVGWEMGAGAWAGGGCGAGGAWGAGDASGFASGVGGGAISTGGAALRMARRRVAVSAKLLSAKLVRTLE